MSRRQKISTNTENARIAPLPAVWPHLKQHAGKGEGSAPRKRAKKKTASKSTRVSGAAGQCCCWSLLHWSVVLLVNAGQWYCCWSVVLVIRAVGQWRWSVVLLVNGAGPWCSWPVWLVSGADSQ